MGHTQAYTGQPFCIIFFLMIILGYHFRNSHIYLFCLEDYPWYLHTVCHHYRNNMSVLSLIYKCLMSCQLECFPTGILTLFFMDEMWSTTMWRSVGRGGGSSLNPLEKFDYELSSLEGQTMLIMLCIFLYFSQKWYLYICVT